GHPGAKLVEHPEQAAFLFGMNQDRPVGLPDLLEQAFNLGIRADHLGSAVAHRAIDDPCADGVHLVDLGKVDGQWVLKRLDFAGGGGGAGDRQRPGDAIRVARAIPRFPRPPGDLFLTGHATRISARNPPHGQVRLLRLRGARRWLPCRRSPHYARRPMPTDPPLLFVPVGSNTALLFGMDARTRACRLAANAGFECADTVEPGRDMLIASLDYAWDPAWLKAMA